MMLQARTTLADYITALQSEGRVSFTRGEAIAALGVSDAAFVRAAARFQKKKTILNPRHGFYVIVPAQYRSWEAPPPSWYIDNLMRHESRPYYVGLLKAAELHGATHHAVMEFQIVTNKQLPKLRAGRSIIAFYFRKDMASLLPGVVDHKTDAGSMKISSPELTALDLLRYFHVVGGVDAVATVLSDLGGKIDGDKLASLAHSFERAIIQRLGYLLDRLGAADKSEVLHHDLFAKPLVPWVTLEPQKRGGKVSPQQPVERNERWHVIVHRHPEIDE